MDSTSLLLSFVFGTIGLGFLLYGKKTGQLVPLSAGLSLMILPYVISNNGILTVVCLALSAAPFVLRQA